MNPLTAEWIQKAEADFVTAEREQRARRSPNYDAACFHCQQCAEKYLKARLQEAGIAPEKTHNLVFLLERCLPLEPAWEGTRLALQLLSQYSVSVRYPGESATREIAAEAVALCRQVRAEFREAPALRV